ncbi:hypothetical protein F7Q99_01350 [Streptomyces kaniharaensis]|uniref:Uncharacterized protein n=1 Tax=Streptomyces kaniharaensis TaxID=212423 RepID=A0A6N7KK55_9ACTN|nr:hypothetical protein [Streptomyces kaniharaensis]MQS10959.1 hypothetical protein [Streptomyces kaniharaensis]
MSAKSPGVRPSSVLAGFALLLVVVFVVAYAVGRQAGPVSPGLTPGRGGGGTPGMSGHDMGGMR